MNPPGQVKSTRCICYNAVEPDVQRTTIIWSSNIIALTILGTEMSLKRGRYLVKKQICVESHPSALNMTLPAFAAERRCLQHVARNYQSISAADAGDQLQTRRPPLLL